MIYTIFCRSIGFLFVFILFITQFNNWLTARRQITLVKSMCFCTIFSRTHDVDERTNLLDRNNNSSTALPHSHTVHNVHEQQRTTADVFNALGIESATQEGLRLSELRKRRILMHERIEDVFQSSTVANATQYLSIGTRECNKATITDNMFVTNKTKLCSPQIVSGCGRD